MSIVSLWGTAAVTEASDGAAAEQGINLGTVFQANVAGAVTHLRFYETPNAQGTVDLRLVDANDAVVASAQYTAINGQSGWRDVALATPYITTIDAWYMVYYHIPSRTTSNLMYSTVDGLTLNTTRTSSGGELETAIDQVIEFVGQMGNGRYQYGALATPLNDFNSENYGADVLFDTEGAGPQPVPIPVSVVASGTYSPSAAISPLSLPIPAGAQENDVLYALILVKGPSATVSATDWVQDYYSGSLGSGTVGTGTGPVALRVMKRVVPAGGLSGSVSFTVTGGNSYIGKMLLARYDATDHTAPMWSSIAGATYSRTTGSTNFGGTGNLNLSLDVDDVLAFVSMAPDDQSANHDNGNNHTLSAAGTTLGTLTKEGTGVTTTGGDSSMFVSHAPVTAGPSTAAPVSTLTGSSSETGGGVFLRLRAVATPSAPPSDAFDWFGVGIPI